MTHRKSKLSSKDLELLKILPNLAQNINKNMKTVDNLINTQRELYSSVSSVNSSNNGLRGLGQSKGKKRKLNLEEVIDIKNIVKQSIEGLNNIFDKETKSDYNITINVRKSSNNPLASSSNSNLGVLKDQNAGGIFNHVLYANSCGNSSNIGTGSNFNKGKILNTGNSTKFEPIEEENNFGNNDFSTNNFSNYLICYGIIVKTKKL